MRSPLVVAVALALVSGCNKSSPKKRGENEVPASVKAATTFCYEGEPTQDRISIVVGLEAPKGLELWKVCPCKPQICYVVGTDEKDQLVKSEDVVFRLLKFTGPEFSFGDAQMVLDILGQPKPSADAPPERPLWARWNATKLSFYAYGYDTEKKAHFCRSYEIDIGTKKIAKEDVTEKYGEGCKKAPQIEGAIFPQ